MTPRELAATLIGQAESLGFALAGVAPVAPTDRGDELRAWIDAGQHGSMAWLSDRADDRADARRVLPGAQSVLMVADQYWPRDRSAQSETAAPGHGRVARYARGRDYHDVMKKRLFTLADSLRSSDPAAETRVFVDTAPVLEREHALRAGLGWIGKHTLLIHRDRGSYLFLGGILTTAALEAPAAQRVETDHCGTCTRCIDACPTDAITPYAVDASRCVSYLTIEHRDRIDPALLGGVGDWLYGCDVCQEVCPHNSPRDGADRHEAYDPRVASFDLLEVLGWTEDDRRAALRGSSMKRAKLPMWRRNALVALANVGDADEAIARSASDDDGLVRETARDLAGRAAG